MRRLTYALAAFGILGLFWMVLAGVRWMWIYPDTSQAVMGMLIGIGGAVVCFGFAYIYEQIKNLKEKQRSQDERWDSFIQDKKAQEEKESWKK